MTISKFKHSSVVAVILGGLLLSSCGNVATSDRVKNQSNEGDSIQSSEAEILYKKKCISCHGTELQGRAGPKLQNIGSKLTEEEIVEVVTNGRKGMPKFGKSISEEEIQSIAKWLSEHK